MDKTQLRTTLKERIRAIPLDLRQAKSQHACRLLTSTAVFKDADSIMFFLSLPDEVDTTDAIRLAWEVGKTVAVPYVDWDRGTMWPVALESLEDVQVCRFGIRMPTRGNPIPVSDLDLVIVPGLGFDLSGNRLGRGRGFYDRFLADRQLRAIRCGFCFSEQLLTKIPANTCDQPVDMIVTNEQVMMVQKGV